jgi:hypothetical protein
VIILFRFINKTFGNLYKLFPIYLHPRYSHTYPFALYMFTEPSDSSSNGKSHMSQLPSDVTSFDEKEILFYITLQFSQNFSLSIIQANLSSLNLAARYMINQVCHIYHVRVVMFHRIMMKMSLFHAMISPYCVQVLYSQHHKAYRKR